MLALVPNLRSLAVGRASAFRVRAARTSPRLTTRRADGFSTSMARGVGKESDLHKENRGQEVEDLKRDHLNKAAREENHWEEGLASDSESNIAADKHAADKSIEQLQKETEQVAKRKHGQ